MPDTPGIRCIRPASLSWQGTAVSLHEGAVKTRGVCSVGTLMTQRLQNGSFRSDSIDSMAANARKTQVLPC